jgi:hypothetical protein
MSLKYKYKKFLVYLKLKDQNKLIESLDENQKLTYSIVKELISYNDSILLIAPLSEVLYINVVNEEEKMFCKIETTKVKIINGKYGYDTFLPEEIMAELKNRFNIRAEYKRRKMEEEISKNVQVSLKLIHEKLNNKFKKNG